MPFYVITKPEELKNIYDTWDECEAVVDEVKGARYQKAHSREEAEALLAGTGVVLSPGLHVFTDGNAMGGVGAVVVWCRMTLMASLRLWQRSLPPFITSFAGG